MSYNPSIGRVLEHGGVKKFQRMVLEKVSRLQDINSKEAFDVFHNNWLAQIIGEIKTNRNKGCSYGQAQKPVNVFLKVYVDWAKLPSQEFSEKLIGFLHVPLNSIIMKTIKERFPNDFNNVVRPTYNLFSLSLSNMNKEQYLAWQNLLRQIYPSKPLLLDVAWYLGR